MRAAILAILVGLTSCGGGGGETCATGQTSCDGTCVDTLTSNDNCGACGKSCSAAQVCGNGMCADSCPADQANCDGTCSDTSTDPLNCGGCGLACDPGDVCVASQCQVPCDTSQLTAAIQDPWGTTWDGLERPAAALDAAAATCQAFGARLPTATELYRVSATQSAAVGMSFHTNYLWSVSPDDKLHQAAIRLSDGTWSSVLATTATPYRCVCPAPQPKTFSGGRCNGDPGSECFQVGGYNVDQKDRPALRKSAALAECVFDRAHLADAPFLAEAIDAGLPGSNALIQTADQAHYDQSTELRWNGVATGWEPNGNLGVVDMRSAAPFRCAGPSGVVSPNPNTIPDEFVAPLSKFKGETMDSAAATWAAAHDACFARGGHLPRSVETAELVSQGQPNGTNAPLWSSDETGYNGTQFLAAINFWTDLDLRHAYSYTGAADSTASWAYKTDSHAYRCIYYPIDAAYQAPTSPANCYAGCFEVDLPGNPAPKMWFDSQDRTAATLGAAFADCAAHGGHLASERDFTEAIRNGLPNGTATMATPWLWTSDFGQGNVTVVRWTNSEPAFTDQYSTYMTWANPASSYRYRCMWTNELR